MSPRPFANKAEAVVVLVDVCRKERQPNVAEFRRLLRALAALGLGPDDQRQACRYLDICRNDGRPWSADLAAQVPWKVDSEARP